MIIDGVFSGGGIKGFALIGAIQVLEEKGFSFNRTAGTSAGSIIAAFIAAGYNGQEINQMLNDMDIGVLLDRRHDWLPIPFAKWLLLYWKLGLYKGDALEKWVGDTLAAKGVRTFIDIPFQSLRIIASDITNGRLVVLPDDLEIYGIDPAAFPIAKAVRMSCSIPYFFEPVKLNGTKRKFGNLFVDGGVLSNFPMWLFDSDHVKKVRPVLGIKLSADDERKKPQKIENAIEMFNALFKTMKDAHDSRYISRKHVKNIIFVPMKEISATDFLLNEESKAILINRGRHCAQAFLRRWSY
ncbi:patatin-like phospholipase family protein [Peribacillus sp. SCS-155]|uniref:patatin-like phospholipase family protein n=1 Tax=Peribacillus sedimenti TaxID=3115297 RepID=UPI0039066313